MMGFDVWCPFIIFISFCSLISILCHLLLAKGHVLYSVFLEGNIKFLQENGDTHQPIRSKINVTFLIGSWLLVFLHVLCESII